MNSKTLQRQVEVFKLKWIPWCIKMEQLNINAVFLVDSIFQNMDSVRGRLGTSDLILCNGFYLVITPQNREMISRSLERVLKSSFTFC